MNNLQQRLFELDRKNLKKRNDVQSKTLRVFYGWARLGKIRKREAISIIFENDRQREERTQLFVKKMQDTVFVRSQTDGEKLDAEHCNRMFTEFNVFLDDKRIKGSLDAALRANKVADRNNVDNKMLNEIEEKLRNAFLSSHRGYKEPTRQLDLFTD